MANGNGGDNDFTAVRGVLPRRPEAAAPARAADEKRIEDKLREPEGRKSRPDSLAERRHSASSLQQGGAVGFDTGNGERLSSSQGQSPRQLLSSCLVSLPFRCLFLQPHSVVSPSCEQQVEWSSPRSQKEVATAADQRFPFVARKGRQFILQALPH